MYKLVDYKLQEVTVKSGVLTRVAVSKPFSLTTPDSLRLTVDILISAATLNAGAFAFFLESSLDGGINWDFTALETIAITTVASRTLLTMQANRAASGVILRPTCRIVVTSTDAGNTVTISSVNVSNRTGYQS